MSRGMTPGLHQLRSLVYVERSPVVGARQPLRAPCSRRAPPRSPAGRPPWRTLTPGARRKALATAPGARLEETGCSAVYSLPTIYRECQIRDTATFTLKTSRKICEFQLRLENYHGQSKSSFSDFFSCNLTTSEESNEIRRAPCIASPRERHVLQKSREFAAGQQHDDAARSSWNTLSGK